MRIDQNVTFFAGGGNEAQGRKYMSSPVFGGAQGLGEDKILMKKKQAQQQALKVVSDVWNKDRKVDDDLKDRREHLKTVTQDYAYANQTLKELEDREAELKNQYGVEDDSQEQKDLELLKKRAASLSGSGEELTEQEMERLGQLDQKGPSEYQLQCMELNQRKSNCRKMIADSKKAMIEENAIIRGISKERLKDSSMVDAAGQAEEIKEAASQEIVGMLLEEARDHIDEEQEKKEEQAEEIKEKKEEQEELLEKRREEKAEDEKELEVTSEELLNLDKTSDDFKKEMQNIVNKMNLVAEDIKGSVVDQIL